MKTKFFRNNNQRRTVLSRVAHLSCLLILLTATFCVSAQNGVTVTNLIVGAGTVTFNVSWDKSNVPAVWSDTVWVFVDYNDAGVMKRLPLAPGATLTTHTAPEVGRVIQYSDNNKGVWVVGNARSAGSFSATVQLLTATADLAGACAYASNYPPVGEYKTSSHVVFTGTPMYELVMEHSGSMTTVQSGKDFYLLPGDKLVSFTDKTGAPGIMKCIPPATYTLQASALDFCAGSEGVQFALLGAEAGRQYQLYKDNSPVGMVLDGAGSAATFSGSFSVAGTYTARTVADDLYCEITMDGTRVVVENPLPADPAVNNETRNCPGTVTLSASSPGAVIDWYATAAATSTIHAGASYTTPEIETGATYYVQARFESTGCLSARVPVSAEVTMENCCHEPGVTDVTFAEFTPCTGAPYGSSYTLTDDRDQKTYKIKFMPDDRYWMAQDLMFGNCNANSFKNDQSEAATTITPTVAEGYVGHCRTDAESTYYNWPAVMNNSKAYYASSDNSFQCTGIGTSTSACQGICPTGWHVPTGKTDGEFYTLHTALASYAQCTNQKCWLNPAMPEVVAGGYVEPNGSMWCTGGYKYWTSTAANANQVYHAHVCSAFTAGNDYYNVDKRWGARVRCVRNY